MKEQKMNINKNINNIGKKITPVAVEFGVIDKRIKNVEKVVSTIKTISNGILGVVQGYLQNKTETEKRQQELEDKQHKRLTVLLIISVILIFCFCMVALILKQTSIIEYVLEICLAFIAGAGVINLLIPGRKKKKEPQE